MKKNVLKAILATVMLLGITVWGGSKHTSAEETLLADGYMKVFEDGNMYLNWFTWDFSDGNHGDFTIRGTDYRLDFDKPFKIKLYNVSGREEGFMIDFGGWNVWHGSCGSGSNCVASLNPINNYSTYPDGSANSNFRRIRIYVGASGVFHNAELSWQVWQDK